MDFGITSIRNSLQTLDKAASTVKNTVNIGTNILDTIQDPVGALSNLGSKYSTQNLRFPRDVENPDVGIGNHGHYILFSINTQERAKLRTSALGTGGSVVDDPTRNANIPAYCDQCIYRSINTGGNGKCPKYEAGAVCSIRDDYIKIINTLDTRKPDDVKAMLDMIAKISFENVLMALTQAKMDGNIPDRNTKSEINTLLAVIKSINDLNTKVVVTQQTELDQKTGDISSIFKQIKAQRSVD